MQANLRARASNNKYKKKTCDRQGEHQKRPARKDENKVCPVWAAQKDHEKQEAERARALHRVLAQVTGFVGDLSEPFATPRPNAMGG
jgi:hypothetical protein